MGLQEVRIKTLEDKVAVLEGELFILKKVQGKKVAESSENLDWLIITLNLVKNLFFVAAGIAIGYLWAKMM